MDTKRFLLAAFTILLIAVIAAAHTEYGLVYTDFRHAAMTIGDGKNSSLNGSILGNGRLADVTCLQNCTGFLNTTGTSISLTGGLTANRSTGSIGIVPHLTNSQMSAEAGYFGKTNPSSSSAGWGNASLAAEMSIDDNGIYQGDAVAGYFGSEINNSDTDTWALNALVSSRSNHSGKVRVVEIDLDKYNSTNTDARGLTIFGVGSGGIDNAFYIGRSDADSYYINGITVANAANGIKIMPYSTDNGTELGIYGSTPSGVGTKWGVTNNGRAGFGEAPSFYDLLVSNLDGTGTVLINGTASIIRLNDSDTGTQNKHYIDIVNSNQNFVVRKVNDDQSINRTYISSDSDGNIAITNLTLPTTKPANPVVGSVWLNSTTYATNCYDGSAWRWCGNGTII